MNKKTKEFLWTFGTIVALISGLIQIITLLDKSPSIDADTYTENSKLIIEIFNQGKQTARIENFSICALDNFNNCAGRFTKVFGETLEIKEKEKKSINTNVSTSFLESLINSKGEWGLEVCEKIIKCRVFNLGVPREGREILAEPSFEVSITAEFYDANGNKIGEMTS
jgi:hypothetical protein